MCLDVKHTNQSLHIVEEFPCWLERFHVDFLRLDGLVLFKSPDAHHVLFSKFCIIKCVARVEAIELECDYLTASNFIIINLKVIAEVTIKNMYHQNPRVRDAQNPYRTGVLIGNCWEDKFGMELAQQPVSH